MLSRRRLVAGGLATGLTLACGCPCVAQAQRVRSTRGCRISNDDMTRIYPNGTDTRMFIQGSEPMIPKSGDRNFDLALAQSLAKLTNILQVTPGFAYYDDYDGLNAYASPNVRLNRADGTVLFGTGLLQKMRQTSEAPEVAVITICAHEFGHVLQFKHNLIDRVNAGSTTVKRSELQADYFAGYFIGIRKRERPSFPAAVAAMTQYGVGDNFINSPQHHGTSDERAQALIKGYEASYKENRTLADAIQISTNYVMRL